MTLPARLRNLVVPQVVGQLDDNARVMLRNAGFPVPVIHYVEDYADDNSVVRADPAPGQLVSSATEVRLYVAKPSLVRFLPNVYQTSTGGQETDFLRRMLRVFQHVFEGIKSQVDGGHRLYRPSEAPTEFLPWLAQWMAIGLDPDWPEWRQRRILRKAAGLYRVRGTRKSLIALIQIFADLQVRVVENAFPFTGFRVGLGRIGVDTMVMPRVNLAHAFVVELQVSEDKLVDEELVKLHRVIQLEKPAHTIYCVQFSEKQARDWAEAPIMQIGVGGRIGDAQETDEEGGGESEPPPQSTTLAKKKGRSTSKAASKTQATDDEPTLSKRRRRAPKSTTRKTSTSKRRTRKKSDDGADEPVEE